MIIQDEINKLEVLLKYNDITPVEIQELKILRAIQSNKYNLDELTAIVKALTKVIDCIVDEMKWKLINELSEIKR